MERIHDPDTRNWIDTKLINVAKWIEQWREVNVRDDLIIGEDKLNERLKEFNLTEQQLIGIENECDIEHLHCDDEDDNIYLKYAKSYEHEIQFNEETNLETVANKREHLNKIKNDKAYRLTYVRNLRYKNDEIIKHKIDEEAQFKLPELEIVTAIENFTAVLTCQIFHPFVNKDENKKLSPHQEIQVLSSQLLTELRDVYTCASDFVVPGDHSNNPVAATSEQITTSNLYKSSFFFIHDTFYNDLRSASCLDYSEVITKWYSEYDRGGGPFLTKKMHETKFEDLNIKLGYPYLFLHQGDCEHLIVFTDISLLDLNSFAVTSLKEFPRFISSFRKEHIKCGACITNTAKWVTYGNNRLPINPFFFCDHCHKSFNYDEDLNKIGEFRCYPFLDKSATL